MLYETATRFGHHSAVESQRVKAKQRMTLKSLEREARLRRHEIKMRIDELRKFIELRARAKGYSSIVAAWRKELLDLHAEMM